MSQFDVPLESRKKYLTRRLEELSRLGESMDLELAKKVGHQMKGNAATFLFPVLAAMGSELEIAANAEDGVLIKKKVREITDTVQKLLTEL